MQVPVGAVAQLVGGRVVGDPAALLSGVAGLNEAKTGDLSFLANPRYAPLVASTQATAILVPEEQPDCRAVQIVVANPDHAFACLVARFAPGPVPPPLGIHPSAVIGDRVVIGPGARIGPQVVIGDGVRIGAEVTLYAQVCLGAEAQLGDACLLHPQVTVRERCRLGNRVVVQPGAVIGSDGFGYVEVEGRHDKIPQVGIVVIEDDVEIGAGTCIDRARFGRTRIGTGSKLDNLVQIAHNVEVGPHCLIVAQAGISGSTKLGEHVTLAGQTGLAGHLTVGDHAALTAQSGLSKNLPAKAVWRGTPAQDMRQELATLVALRHLPATERKVKALEQRVAELEARLATAQP